MGQEHGAPDHRWEVVMRTDEFGAVAMIYDGDGHPIAECYGLEAKADAEVALTAMRARRDPRSPLRRDPAYHEGRPRLGSIRGAQGGFGGGAQHRDYPLTARCEDCGEAITCTSSTSDWGHVVAEAVTR